MWGGVVPIVPRAPGLIWVLGRWAGDVMVDGSIRGGRLLAGPGAAVGAVHADIEPGAAHRLREADRRVRSPSSQRIVGAVSSPIP